MLIFRELLQFLMSRRKFWMIPLILLLALVGVLLVATQGSVLAPFVYTIF